MARPGWFRPRCPDGRAGQEEHLHHRPGREHLDDGPAGRLDRARASRTATPVMRLISSRNDSASPSNSRLSSSCKWAAPSGVRRSFSASDRAPCRVMTSVSAARTTDSDRARARSAAIRTRWPPGDLVRHSGIGIRHFDSLPAVGGRAKKSRRGGPQRGLPRRLTFRQASRDTGCPAASAPTLYHQ